MSGRIKLVLLSPVAFAAALLLVASLAHSLSFALSDDLSGVKERGVLRHLGIPYAKFISEDGQEGLDVQLVRLFADYLGVRYQYVNTSWEDVLGGLTGKRLTESSGVVVEVPVRGDLIANGFTILPARERIVDYSVPTFLTQIWLVCRSSSPTHPIQPTGDIDRDILAVRSLLKGCLVMGKANTCLDPSLYDLQKAGARVVNFDGSLNSLAMELLSGKADFSLIDMPDALIALEKMPGEIKIIGPLSRVQFMGFAFAKESPLLRESFNKFFKKVLEDGTYARLVKKYYPGFGAYFPDFLSPHRAF